MSSFSYSLFIILPQFLVYLFGLAVCGAYWRRCPVAAGWAMGGIALMLVAFVANYAGPMWVVQTTSGPAGATSILTEFSIIATAARTVGFLMMLVAVFWGRGEQNRRGFEVPMATRV